MTYEATSSDVVKRAAIAAVKSDSDTTTLQAVATILKYSAEAEKAAIETRNISRSSSTEAFRFYIPVIAPLVSAMAVVGALVFQTIQFRETSRMQAQTVEIQRQTVELQARSAEDNAWREALKTLTQSPNVMSGRTGTTLLSAYLTSGSHIEEARALSLSLLGDLQFVGIFKPLFETTIKATPPEKQLSAIADLSFQLRQMYFRLSNAANDMRPKPNPELPVLIDQRGKEFSNPLFARDQVGEQLTAVCDSVASILRTTHQKPAPSATLGFTIWNCDMSGVNFEKLGLIGSNIQSVSLTGADLSSLTDYSNSNWSNTAWWRAKKIEKGLLKYLIDSFPFSEKGAYYEVETRNGYKAEIARLQTEK